VPRAFRSLLLLAPLAAFAQSNPEILSPGPVLAPDGGPLEVRLVATNASTAFNNLFATWRVQLAGRTLTASFASNLPAGSRDAAVVLDVAPDAYSVQVRNRAAGGGVVLVEVYEVP